MDDLISVIVPAYNAENYIRECLDSVFRQTYENIEVIVINDGSQDGTLEILKEYEITYDNMQVLNIENNGQGHARNLGLSMARGEYVLFLDADDFISPITLEYSKKQIEKDGSDLCFFNWSRFEDTEKVELPIRKKRFLEDGLLKDNECLKMLDLRPYYTVMNMYRRKFLIDNDITYGEGYLYEDVIFWLKVVISASRISVIKDKFYRIRAHRSSSTGSERTSDRHMDSFIKLIGESNAYVTQTGRKDVNAYYDYIANRFFIYQRDRVAEEKKAVFAERFLEAMHSAPVNMNNRLSEELAEVMSMSENRDVQGLMNYAKDVQADKEQRMLEKENARKKLAKRNNKELKKKARSIKNLVRNMQKYAYFDAEVEKGTLFVDTKGTKFAKDMIAYINRMGISDNITTVVVVEDAYAEMHVLKKHGYKVVSVKRNNRNYYRRLYKSRYLLADTTLFREYIKKDTQTLILSIEEMPKDIIQERMLCADYLWSNEEQEARRFLKDYEAEKFFAGKIVTKDSVVDYLPQKTKKSLVCFNAFNSEIKYADAACNTSEDELKVFLVEEKLIRNNPNLIDFMRKKGLCIIRRKNMFPTTAKERVLHKDKVRFGKYDERAMRQLFGSIRFDEVVIEDKELSYKMKSIKNNN